MIEDITNSTFAERLIMDLEFCGEKQENQA
jgi:hypothetical protein